MRSLSIIIGLLILSTCTAQKVDHTLYLIGDAGVDGSNGSAPVLDLMKQLLQEDISEESTVLFLGDNIYPDGLHKEKHPLRLRDEQRLDVQIDAVKDLGTRLYFIPGDHDWRQGGEHGIKYLQRQEKYVEKKLDRNAFRPDDACPGPDVVKLGENAVLIMIDTQWWLSNKRRSEGEKDGCEVSNEAEFIQELRVALKDNKDKQIIVAGHHPLYTYGEHGGHYPISDHIFPLRAMNKNLYLPLPVLGSIYPLYRKLVGNIQDVAHVKYELLKDKMNAAFKEYPGVVYASGHEHNLQYQQRAGTHYIVSGSGSKSTYLRMSVQLRFGTEEKGLSRIRFFKDGSCTISFFTAADGVLALFNQELHAPQQPFPIAVEDAAAFVRVADSISVVPNEQLKAGGLKKLIFGSLYRDVWTTPITVPIIDLDTAHGGLTPLKKGGGLQTHSLRLEGNDGKQYVFRSIEKFPGAALVPELRATIAEDVISDGIAGSHPYAAVMVGALAEPLGVHHTNPQVVYVPDHPALGEFREEFGNMLVLYEERPEGNTQSIPELGDSKELVGSPDLIENLRGSHKHQVDRRSLIRHRLFDMLIGDWDRHDDQWRWATYKNDGTTTYKPIPRDRDQAFFKQNGLIPSLVNRQWGIRKFQSYGPTIRDVVGQGFNARYLDRAYLAGASWNDWKEVVDSLKTEMTDAVIERAVRQFPKPAYDIMGQDVIIGLKGRRNGLEKIAHQYYEFLAKTVDVVGTDKGEFFEVIRLNNNETEVNIYDREHGEKIKKRQYFHRVFNRKETKEIRIYGLEGDDEYRVEGNVKKGIKVRIVGGFEKDVFRDNSSVVGLSHKTLIYDSKEKKKKKRNKAKLGKEAKMKLFKASDAFDYERNEFVHDQLMPLVTFGANPDDGLFLGGGFQLTKQGFKVSPYKWRHRALGSYAFSTGAYAFNYKGRVNQVLGNWGLGLDADIRAPQNNFNYFGIGNETERPSDVADFRYRINTMDVHPFFSRTFNEQHTVSFGPNYFLAGETKRIIDGVEEVFDVSEEITYFGAGIKYAFINQDHPMNPSRGVRFNVNANWDQREDTREDQYRWNSSLRLYIPMSLLSRRSVLALRAGGGRNDNDYHPTLARMIGGNKEVRGLRQNRFAGNSNAYFNAELRMDLIDLRNSIIPFKIGVLGFADRGRVWVDDLDEGNTWHRSFGGGLYITPLNMLVLQASYGISDDDEIVDVRLGFFF